MRADAPPKRPVKRNRRAFLKAAVAGLAGTAVACEEGPPPEVGSRTARTDDLGHIDRLQAGETTDFAWPERRNAAFMVKMGRPVEGGVGPDGDIVAFQRACPHMGCRIGEVNVERGTFGPCRCHGSMFDIERGGRQIHGRATQPLVKVQLEVLADGTVCAVGLDGLAYGEALHSDDGDAA